MKNRPLFLQILYFLLPIYIIGFGVQYYFIGPFIEQFYLEETKNHLTSKANLIQTAVNKNIDKRDLQNFIKKAGYQAEIRITLLDTLGTVIADSDNNPKSMENHRKERNRNEIETAILKGVGSSQRYSTTTKQEMFYVAILTKYENEPFIIRTSQSIASLNSSINIVRNKIALNSLVILFIIGITVIIVSNYITRPLFMIGEAAKKISSEGVYKPITKIKKGVFSNTEEIHSITVALNDMASELNRRIETITKERNEQKDILNYMNIIQYTMSEGLLTISLSNEITTINKAAGKYLELDTIKDLGQNYNKRIKDKGLKKTIKTIIKKGRPITKEIRIGKTKKSYFSVNGGLLKNQKSKPVGCLIVMTNVTRLKRLEAMRRVFVANVSHELKTPITSIGGYIETAKEDIPPKKKNEFLIKAYEQTNRLNSIIDDLLRLSRIEALQDEDTFTLKTQKLLMVIDGSLEDIRQTIEDHKSKISVKCSDKITVPIDFQLIREALNNLLENAIKYGESQNSINLTVKQKPNFVHIDISNKGEPIPQKAFKRIFNRFYRLDKSRSKKTGGTGLGLAIVKHIALVHNGSISVYKSDSEKTIFRLTLPSSLET